MQATHFGAGNIGRGFIGEILAENGFAIDFVDINETIINALNERNAYTIQLADESQKEIHVSNVDGLNNQTNPDAVIASVSHADIVTTAIGPNILPFIAELIAKGIQKRRSEGNTTPLDVIACENMIGGSQFLFEKVQTFLSAEDMDYVEQYIGFPNAAVDRIVPIQHHEDPLFVSVEPFSEWVIDATQSKNKELRLEGVEYVEDLEPYIERKLFSVNTGHATVAYTGAYEGYTTIDEAIADQRVLDKLRAVLGETGSLLINKWNFDEEKHFAYIDKIVSRFENKYISDSISRVARTPIRKLGYDERFIRPIRELKERGLAYTNLVDVVAMVLNYDDQNDEQSVELQDLLKEKAVLEVIQQVTGLKDDELIAEIAARYQK
ncbi:mannitol-1-phosphate 5-dehydrogenase [Enterococcus pseudoavium]|uniref:Mannitol-1-phosphate 5-dehydrogenase n=1 Tax=Enterococcus pseudoavium TaxID=44007 RepID=A0ABU3FHQ3_9ENTE|nr:mannitol-1-phosphate 5-dehydrogenase [Enterococcus pseudoavium]MDT2753362.1 mannitol-1-phosphate 5-dehydrogenase [Enterococcus pseudoavium]MDT2770599.1 mannitol-1-phosphate 5-dehydrogenase [Enterococcus pseudoavium]